MEIKDKLDRIGVRLFEVTYGGPNKPQPIKLPNVKIDKRLERHLLIDPLLRENEHVLLVANNSKEGQDALFEINEYFYETHHDKTPNPSSDVDVVVFDWDLTDHLVNEGDVHEAVEKHRVIVEAKSQPTKKNVLFIDSIDKGIKLFKSTEETDDTKWTMDVLITHAKSPTFSASITTISCNKLDRTSSHRYTTIYRIKKTDNGDIHFMPLKSAEALPLVYSKGFFINLEKKDQ